MGQQQGLCRERIPQSGFINTNELEPEPLWNKVSDAKLYSYLLKLGITANTPVILYGEQVMAAARVAHLLMYAGVKDVRLLDGGWHVWQRAGFATETGKPVDQQPAHRFADELPKYPEYITSINQARLCIDDLNSSLVSIRSWPEVIGETSGDSYISQKGDIQGAKWGRQ